MDDTYTTLLRHGDCQAALGHSIHCGGHYRDVEADPFCQLGFQFNVIRKYFRVSGDQ